MTLVICLGQLSASKLHNDLNLKESNCHNFCGPPDFYLPTWENVTPPYTSLNLAHNLLSGRLWGPLLQIGFSVARTNIH